MKTFQKTLWIIVMVGLLTLACNMPWQAALAEEDVQETAVAETVAAQLTLQLPSSTAAPPTAALTSPPSPTPPATLTSIPSATPLPTATVIPCNRAVFFSDITYPDGSEVTVNKNFVKTWRLQNNGSCTWTSGYKLLFFNGDRMGAPDEVALTGGSVAPGQTVDVSVSLTAPASAGTYKGDFKIKAPDGQIFGIGASGNAPFYVEIKATPFLLLITPLVIITPLFPLLPEANVSYATQAACSGKYYLKFKVENTGTIAIESYSITAKDISGSQTTNNSQNVFGMSDDCISIANSAIAPGASGYFTSGPFNFQLIGSNVTATIKLYPQDNQSGFYAEKTLNFVE